MHYSECRALLFFGVFSLLPMAAAHGYEAYISNEKDNTVSVVDLDKMAVVRTYQVGQRPRGITMTKDGQFILLCASDDDTVQVHGGQDRQDRQDADVRPRSGAVHSASIRQSALHRQ